MPTSPEERRAVALESARRNPELGRRLLEGLPDDVRVVAVAALTRPRHATTSLQGPGLRKCGLPRANNGFSAQLSSFAESVSRVS